MSTEKDLWFYFAVLVAVVTTVAWAMWSAIDVGPSWVPWVLIFVSVLSLGSVGVRAWLRARGVVWTDDMKAAQRQRNREWPPTRLIGSLPLFAFCLGQIALINLENAGVFSDWMGLFLWFGLLLGCIWLWRFVQRIKV